MIFFLLISNKDKTSLHNIRKKWKKKDKDIYSAIFFNDIFIHKLEHKEDFNTDAIFFLCNHNSPFLHSHGYSLVYNIHWHQPSKTCLRHVEDTSTKADRLRTPVHVPPRKGGLPRWIGFLSKRKRIRNKDTYDSSGK